MTIKDATFKDKIEEVYDMLWNIHEEGDLSLEEDEFLVKRLLNPIDGFMGR